MAVRARFVARLAEMQVQARTLHRCPWLAQLRKCRCAEAFPSFRTEFRCPTHHHAPAVPSWGGASLSELPHGLVWSLEINGRSRHRVRTDQGCRDRPVQEGT